MKGTCTSTADYMSICPYIEIKYMNKYFTIYCTVYSAYTTIIAMHNNLWPTVSLIAIIIGF